MKKAIFLLILIGATITTSAMAQNGNKKQAKQQKEQSTLSKKEIKKQQQEQQNAILNRAIERSEFRFSARELTSAPRLPMANIRLMSDYFLDVNQGSLRCYLPVYGSNKAYSGPQIQTRLEFFLTKGEFSVESTPLKKGGWLIVIKTLKKLGVNTYTFRITTTESGLGSQLSVSTDFAGAANFSGDIFPN